MKLPSLTEIEQLHHEIASDKATFDLVFTHSQIVWEIAKQLIEKCGRDPRLRKDDGQDIDTAFVRAGCLLHDIGAYKLLRQGRLDGLEGYIRHGIEGYDLLKERGYPEALCRVCSHHTGVGLTKEKILSRNLPLPLADFEADTREEQLIMYADKFHSKNPIFNSFTYYKMYVSQFGVDDAEKFEELKELFGLPDLHPLAKKYQMKIR